MSIETREVWLSGAIQTVTANFGPPPSEEEIAALQPPGEAPGRSVAMWRARTIMKVTPWGDGTLFEAVRAAIAAVPDPLEKAAAEEALERGSVFDLDGETAPRLMFAVGMDEAQALELLAQARLLPA